MGPRGRCRAARRAALATFLLTIAATAAAQQPPREFVEFRGTWIRDETAGSGRIAALPIASRLVIETSPTEIRLIKDGRPPEIYPLDGREFRLKDERTGALLDRTYRFTLVAEMLALTSTQTRGEGGGAGGGSRRLTNIITDAYAVADDVLTVERQLSVLIEPPGHLATLAEPRNNRQTIVYRREGAAR